jgi:hypothetical protein
MAGKLAFGDQCFGAIGKRTRLETLGARKAADSFEIEIGAARVGSASPNGLR